MAGSKTESKSSKIKRDNVRKMTWIALIALLTVGFKILFVGIPTGTEQILITFLWVLASIVLGYVGVSVTSDTFNAHSERKHKADE